MRIGGSVMALEGVVTTSIASIAGQLAGDFTKPRGKQALGILYEMASGAEQGPVRDRTVTVA